MTNERREYARLRVQGWSAGEALRTARTNVRFSQLEAAGVARLRVEPDSEPYDASFIDAWDDMSEAERKREKAEILTRANNEGVYGFVCEIRNPYRHELWEQVDACWGFIGDDWRNSGYDTQAKDSAIEALAKLATSAIERRAAQVRALSRDALESLALDVCQVLYPDAIPRDSDAWEVSMLDAVHNTLDLHGLVP